MSETFLFLLACFIIATAIAKDLKRAIIIFLGIVICWYGTLGIIYLIVSHGGHIPI